MRTEEVVKKIDNLKELEISTDVNLLSELIYEQIKKRKTPNLEKMRDSIVRLSYYFLETKNDRRLYEIALSDYRLARNRAIERARKSEKENEKLRKQIKSNSY
jgi:hypothetical protein